MCQLLKCGGKLLLLEHGKRSQIFLLSHPDIVAVTLPALLSWLLLCRCFSRHASC
jgi:hypothetical protein